MKIAFRKPLLTNREEMDRKLRQMSREKIKLTRHTRYIECKRTGKAHNQLIKDKEVFFF